MAATSLAALNAVAHVPYHVTGTVPVGDPFSFIQQGLNIVQSKLHQLVRTVISSTSPNMPFGELALMRDPGPLPKGMGEFAALYIGNNPMFRYLRFLPSDALDS